MTLQSETGWTRTIGGGLIVLGLLAIEHLAFYREQDFQDDPEMVLLGSNILGTATIAVGVAIASRSADEVVRHITVASIGGAGVVILRIVRRFLRSNNTLHDLAGHGIGLIDGVRNGQAHTRTGERDF